MKPFFIYKGVNSREMGISILKLPPRIKPERSQSNQRMIDALAQRLEIEESKVISNIEHYGNMSAASILVAIREGINNGEIKLPATLMLSAFGAGMTAGNAIIKLDNNI